MYFVFGEVFLTPATVIRGGVYMDCLQCARNEMRNAIPIHYGKRSVTFPSLQTHDGSQVHFLATSRGQRVCRDDAGASIG